MNNKKFFFMAGLQRSGATMLSSILNQNKDIYSSPASPLLPMLLEAEKGYSHPQNIDYDRSKDIFNVSKNIANHLYEDYEQQYIIDKNHWWTIPMGVELINKYVTNDIKIICPVRDIIEVLSSFNTIIEKSKKSKDNNIDKQTLIETFDDKPMPDRRAEWLMRPKSDINTHLYGMSFAKDPKFRHMFYFVEYNDIINNPQITLDGIHEFLDIPKFEYKFEGLKNDIPAESLTGIYNLHRVRPSIEKISIPPQEAFLPETINRYSGLEFWRGL